MAVRPLLLTMLAVAVFTLGGLLGYANTAPVHFDYLLGTLDRSLIEVMMIAFAVGIGLTLLVVALRLLGLRGELRQLRRQLDEAQAELRMLRNLPAPSVLPPISTSPQPPIPPSVPPPIIPRPVPETSRTASATR